MPYWADLTKQTKGTGIWSMVFAPWIGLIWFPLPFVSRLPEGLCPLSTSVRSASNLQIPLLALHRGEHALKVP